MRRSLFALSLTIPLLSGCIAKTAVDIVTLPVKVASKGVDMATTSQSESDQKRGKALRQREEQLGKLARQRDKLAAKCVDGNDDACDQQQTIEGQIEELQNAPYR